jgi:hypothetical protein
MTLDTNIIEGEQGAISMEATVHPTTPGQVDVECLSHDPPYVMLDETGAPTAMTQVTPPTADGTPGTYTAVIAAVPDGPHAIICYNAQCRVRQRLFIGTYPAWDAAKVAENIQKPIDDAAAIAATTSRLG